MGVQRAARIWSLAIAVLALSACATSASTRRIADYDDGCSHASCAARAYCVSKRLQAAEADADAAVAQLDRLIRARKSGRLSEPECLDAFDEVALQSFTIEGEQRAGEVCGPACRVVLGGIAVGVLAAAAASAGGGGDDSGGSVCCRVCRTGKACGDSCISVTDTCHVGRGCACDG